MDGVILTPLKKITHPRGDIFHAMKRSDNGFDGFGEAYFSIINKGDIKGWKKHTKVTMNIVVPIGAIKFTIFNDVTHDFLEVIVSQDNYQRLTVLPDLWVSFKGIECNNMLLNIANIEHDPFEAINIGLDEIKINSEII
jgi:dTDP-4-dehydrorhamnose 3,5-epimerase